MTMCSRVLVYDDNGQVLLVKHKHDGLWHLPGGGVEVGETLQEGAVRELLEETGVEALAPPVLKSAHLNLEHSMRDHIFLLLVPEWRQKEGFSTNGEIEEIGFFLTSALPINTTSGTKLRIGEQGGTLAISDLW